MGEQGDHAPFARGIDAEQSVEVQMDDAADHAWPVLVESVGGSEFAQPSADGVEGLAARLSACEDRLTSELRLDERWMSEGFT